VDDDALAKLVADPPMVVSEQGAAEQDVDAVPGFPVCGVVDVFAQQEAVDSLPGSVKLDWADLEDSDSEGPR
jgi:hypothetical protein